MLPAMGLPLDGGINTLTKEQKISLKECWKYWFDLLSDAPAIGTIQKEPIAATQPKGLTDEEIGVWKSEQETITSKAALVRLGSDELNRLFWLAVGIENVDALLLRFLRARKWSITAAVNMMLACLQWRSGFGVERIFTKGEEGMNIDGIKQLKVGKTYTQGTDRFGRPVLYVHVKNHRTNDQDAKALEEFIVFQMESVRYLLTDGVDKIVLVFNMSGFGIKNMDWRCVLFLVKCLEAYYPESLHMIIIHNAPWVFQGIWKLLAPMLDPVVRNKVEFTKSTHELEVHIPANHIIKELGGTSTWSWNYTGVVQGENALQSDALGRERAQNDRNDLINSLTEITKEWILSPSPQIDKKREIQVKKLKFQFFELDQFIRGKGVYDRNNLSGNGLIFFDYGGELEPELEVVGYIGSREYLGNDIARLEKELLVF